MWSVGNVLAGNIFLSRVAVYKTVGVPSVIGFFISDRLSDGTGNYRRLAYRQTKSVGDTVGNNFTDGCHALHRWN
jgi:hypothetical protein